MVLQEGQTQHTHVYYFTLWVIYTLLVLFYFRCCLQGQGHERPEDPDGQTGKTGFLCFWAPDIACCLEEAFLTV